MKLDIPNLLLVQSPKESEPKVNQIFIDMLCEFMQRNRLHKDNVLEIMVSAW